MAGSKTTSLFQYYKRRTALDAAKENMPLGEIRRIVENEYKA